MASVTELNLPNIEDLIASEGTIEVGYQFPIGQIAVASDGHQALAMLRQQPDESLADVLVRLDEAIEEAVEHGQFADEING
jgi:hypothetical protein